MSNPDTDSLNWLDQIADEFALRLRQGDRPAIEEYVRQRPGLETEIREMLGMAHAIESAQRMETRRDILSSRELPVISNYRIIREIGRGGMGVVYEAEHEILNRRVALKVLAPHLCRDANSVRRFRQEARAAGKLRHPNIVAIFEVSSEDSEQLYYTMPLVTGSSLDQIIHTLRTGEENCSSIQPKSEGSATSSHSRNSNELSVSVQRLKDSRDSGAGHSVRSEYFTAIAKIGQQVAEALAYAHQHGILHRDIKPSNILLDVDGIAWISDFGLAKDLHENQTITTDLAGTLRYMAPERFAGRFDERSDVYSLGLVLYELSTLSPAFSFDERARMIEAIRAGEFVEPRRSEPSIPSDLNTIICKAAAHTPSDRYISASALAEDLHRYLTYQPIQARKAGPIERVLKWNRRHPSITVFMTAMTIAAVVMAVLWRLSEHNRLLAEDARRDAEHLVYFRDIALANQEFNANKLERSRSILDNCQVEHRNWEWHFMLNRLDQVAWCSPQLGNEVSSVACSPDARYVAAGLGSWRHESDAPIFLWDVKANAVKFELRGQSPCQFTSMEFNHDGSLLLTSARVWDRGQEERHGEVWVWDVATGEPKTKITGIDSEVAHFSPDGASIFAGDLNGGLFSYRLADGQRLQEFVGCMGNILDLTFSRDGKKVAASARNGALCVWDIQSATLLSKKTNLRDPRCVSWSPNNDQRLTVISYDGLKYVYQLEGENLVLRSEQLIPSLKFQRFSKDGGILASSVYGNGIVMEDGKQHSSLGTLCGHGGRVNDYCFDASGRILVTCGQDGLVKLWDLSSLDNSCPESSLGTPRVADAAYSPDSTHVTLAFKSNPERSKSLNGKPRAEVRDCSSMDIVHELIGHENWLTTVAYNASGRLLITGSLDKTVRVWNADSAIEIVKFCEHEAPITAAQFLPNSHLAISADLDGVVCTWNALDGTSSQKWRIDNRIVGIGYIKQRDLILVATSNGVLSFWDHQRARCIKEIPVSPSEIQLFRISPDSKMVALILVTRDVVLWSTGDLLGVEYPKPLSKFAAQSVATTSLDFSPDATRLVIAYDDASMRIIEPRSSQEILQIQKGTSIGSIVRFRPDGKEILHMRTNRTMLQWKCQTDQGATESNRIKEWHEARAEWAEGQFEHMSAFHHYSSLMELEPKNQEHLRNRARSALFSGNFQAAIEDYTCLLENNPVTWDQIYLARALLGAGDVEGYAQQCSRMKTSIAKNRSLSTVNAYLWTCCLTQGLVEERQAGLKQFESLVSKSENVPRNLFTTHAFACYREGRYQDAVQLAQKAIRASADDENPCSFVVLALAISKLQSGVNDRSVLAVENNTLVSPKEYVEMLQKWYRDQQDHLSAGATPDTLAIRFMNFELPLLVKELEEIGLSE